MFPIKVLGSISYQHWKWLWARLELWASFSHLVCKWIVLPTFHGTFILLSDVWPKEILFNFVKFLFNFVPAAWTSFWTKVQQWVFKKINRNDLLHATSSSSSWRIFCERQKCNGITFRKSVQLLAYADHIDIIGRTKQDVIAAFSAIEWESFTVAVNSGKTMYMLSTNRDVGVLFLRLLFGVDLNL